MTKRSGRPVRLGAGWWITAFTLACGGPADTDEVETDTPVYPSDFQTGKYRATSITLLPEDRGVDLDGDGTVDNNLPFALTTADTVVRDLDLSPAGIQAQLDAALESRDLNLLVEADYDRGALSLALLSATWDPEGERLSIDPASLDQQGEPRSRLEGVFEDATTFAGSAEEALVPLTFIAGEPPALVPVRRVRLAGTLDAERGVATLTGVLPAEPLANDVLAPLIPEEGVGNLSREQLLGALRTFAALETIADIDLGNGERGVSCALEITMAPAAWEDP